MLGSRSLMGHGIYLSAPELKVLSRTKTAIVHCPTSNAPIEEQGLGSGLFDFKQVEKAKVNWALGSDIGGGPFLSMLDVMRSFVHQNGRQGILGATYVKALYRATLAGAEILGLKNQCGNLDRGKFADFVVLPLPGVDFPKNPEEFLKHIIEPLKDRREDYDHLPVYVSYRGQVFFNQFSSS
jgi:guanine deaminase